MQTNGIVTRFDYDVFDGNTAKLALDAAIEIKSRIVGGAENAWVIGQQLNRVKELIPNGKWETWLSVEFEMSAATARRFMAVARTFPNGIAGVQISQTALYRLASPDVDDETRQSVLGAGGDGETITEAKVKDAIQGGSAQRDGHDCVGEGDSKTEQTVAAGGKVLESPLSQLSGDMGDPVTQDDDGFNLEKSWRKIENAINRFRDDCIFDEEEGRDDVTWLADKLQIIVDDLRHS